MQSPTRQRGMGVLGWLLVIGLIAAVAITIIKVVPHYLTFMSIRTACTAMAPEVLKGSKKGIFDNLQKRFKVENIYDTDPEDVINIQKESGRVTLVIDYEVREPMVGNAGIYLEFQEDVVRNL